MDILKELLSNPYVVILLGMFGISGVGGLVVLVARTLASYFITIKNVDKVGDAIRARLAKYAKGSEKNRELAIILAEKVKMMCGELVKEMEDFLRIFPKKKPALA